MPPEPTDDNSSSPLQMTIGVKRYTTPANRGSFWLALVRMQEGPPRPHSPHPASGKANHGSLSLAGFCFSLFYSLMNAAAFVQGMLMVLTSLLLLDRSRVLVFRT